MVDIFFGNYCIVNIPDAGLQSLIRRTLEKSEGAITCADMASLSVLDSNIGASTITNLEGLQYAVNLTRFHIYSNQLSDISELSSLTKLTYLDLNSNKISDISSLSNLNNLQYLDLGNNQFSDISSLSNLTSLQVVSIWGNKISDISALVENTGVAYGTYRIDLWSNCLTGQDDLDNMAELEARNPNATNVNSYNQSDARCSSPTP